MSEYKRLDDSGLTRVLSKLKDKIDTKSSVSATSNVSSGTKLGSLKIDNTTVNFYDNVNGGSTLTFVDNYYTSPYKRTAQASMDGNNVGSLYVPDTTESQKTVNAYKPSVMSPVSPILLNPGITSSSKLGGSYTTSRLQIASGNNSLFMNNVYGGMSSIEDDLPFRVSFRDASSSGVSIRTSGTSTSTWNYNMDPKGFCDVAFRLYTYPNTVYSTWKGEFWPDESTYSGSSQTQAETDFTISAGGSTRKFYDFDEYMALVIGSATSAGSGSDGTHPLYLIRSGPILTKDEMDSDLGLAYYNIYRNAGSKQKDTYFILGISGRGSSTGYVRCVSVANTNYNTLRINNPTYSGSGTASKGMLLYLRIWGMLYYDSPRYNDAMTNGWFKPSTNGSMALRNITTG